MTIKREIKFRIAKIIDKLFDRACWAALVGWAMDLDTFRNVFLGGTWKEQPCRSEDGYYCGKCRWIK